MLSCSGVDIDVDEAARIMGAAFDFGLNRKHVLEACDQACERLGLAYLDLYFCHRPDPETSIEETVRLGRSRINVSSKEIVERSPAMIEIVGHVLRDECRAMYC